MVNEHDLEDWDDRPPKQPRHGVNTPTGYTPLAELLKQLLDPSIDVQIDFGAQDENP